ncbi:MAG: glycosyltransferase family 2 protein [Pseudomonadota bacterium]
MPPRFAVIIPHYNDVRRLDRCLEALGRNDLSDTEVIVVDNGSTEDVGTTVARHRFASLVVETGRGAALARNRGVAESTAERIFFLDADCIPEDDWVAVAKLAVDKADIVGGAVILFDETPPPRTGAQVFETVFAFNYRDYILRKGFSVTANLLTRRSVFAAVGPFIDGLSEDEEWCLRARSRGFGLALEERLKVRHPTRPDWPSLIGKWRRLNREMFRHRVAREGTLRGRLQWLARGIAMPASVLVHMPRVLRDPRLTARERLQGIWTLARLRVLRAGWMLSQAISGRA